MKTTPYAHQLKEFTEHGHDYLRGQFWEPGTGKTKTIIDSACQLFLEGKINGILVLAPNGVHRNWVSDEFPAHLWPNIEQCFRTMIWYSNTARTVGAKYELEWVLANSGLSVLVMSYNAIMTELGRAAAKQFLTKRKCMYVLDESTRIKTPGAKTTKRVLASARYADYRRILTGTPVANSPMDLYTQIEFLDPAIWQRCQCRTFAAFKTYFGVWENRVTPGGQRYERCVEYRNLDQLTRIVESVGSRILKEDALDLPPKVYQRRYFTMLPEQSKQYKTLREEYQLELENGEFLTAALAIVRLLRLQEICCGCLLPNGENPRIALLKEVLEEEDCKAIIWCRFHADIDAVLAALGDSASFIDGRVVNAARGEALDDFQKRNKTKYLVANPAAIGEGVTLTEATLEVYYSNSFNLTQRIQSEDRPHRIGQQKTVRVVDLIAENTVDEKIVDALRKKKEIADEVMGDGLRSWL